MGNAVIARPVDALKKVISSESVQSQFKNALAENTPLFIASLIDVFSSDRYLQQCSPNAVVMEALKAATLKLPINKGLGFAYLVSYKNVPQMQIGYKGYIQLAIRTGQYKHINAGAVFEGEQVHQERISGEVNIIGTPTSDKAIGYFAHLETLNGFRKTIYWTRKQVEAHAEKFSKIYRHDNSVWKSNFDSMAIKTVLRNLLSKYAIMSVEMIQAFSGDQEPLQEVVEREVQENANREVIDIQVKDVPPDPEPIPPQAVEEIAVPPADEEPDF